MSVIGLTLSLTHLLMRTRSVQDLLFSTTSRGALVVVLHSVGRAAQNSTQPIGARVAAPVDTNSRSLAWALCVAIVAARAKTHVPSIPLYFKVIVWPLVRPWASCDRKPLDCR